MKSDDETTPLCLRDVEQAVLDNQMNQAVVDSLPPVFTRLRELATQLLLERMQRLCRKYCDGANWTEGFEFTLWRAVVEGPVRMSEDEVNELDQLSDDAGGWWTWPQGAEEALFEDLEEWRKIYDKGPRRNKNLAAQNDVLRAKIEELEAQLRRGDVT